MPFDYAVSAFLTLFVVVDPIGLTPTFLAVTDGLPRTARRLVAVRASIIAGIILAGSTLIGDWLLETLQISLAARSEERREGKYGDPGRSPTSPHSTARSGDVVH